MVWIKNKEKNAYKFDYQNGLIEMFITEKIRRF